MSTRANVIITDEYSTVLFYRHSDGYPSETGESLKEFVKGYSKHMRNSAMQSGGWLILHGHKEYGTTDTGMKWKVGAYEPTDSLHGDVEYVYVIDLVNGVLRCLETASGFSNKASLANTQPCAAFLPHAFPMS